MNLVNLEHRRVFEHFGENHELDLSSANVDIRQLGGRAISVGGSDILHLKTFSSRNVKLKECKNIFKIMKFFSEFKKFLSKNQLFCQNVKNGKIFFYLDVHVFLSFDKLSTEDLASRSFTRDHVALGFVEDLDWDSERHFGGAKF